MHSTFSDGKDDIETLINHVKEAKIKTFALTDHDTSLGCRTILQSPKIINQIKNNDLEFVVGMEVSCLFGKYEMHILAYDFNPSAPEVLEIEQAVSDLLKQKHIFRLKSIEEAGFKLSQKSFDFLNTRVNVRKLDYANCLVNDGYFANVEDACKQFLNPMKYKGTDRLDAVEVLKKLTGIGAKMVWAHSLHGLNEKPITFEEVEWVVGELKQYGLAGLECFYSLYNKDEIQGLVEIAERNGLFITCGSDYHGKNKEVQLAEMSSDGSSVDYSKIKIHEIFKNTIK